MATIIWELGLGVWLLSGLLRLHAWLAAVVTFSVFATVSGWLSWLGVASCGCFGAVVVSPRLILALDVLVLGVLIARRPRATHGWIRVGAVTGATFSAVTALFVATQLTAFGGAVLDFLSRGSLEPARRVIDFGTMTPGQVATQDVSLDNKTTEPVRLVGGTTDCSAMVAGATTTIPPGQSVTVTIHFRVANDATPGVFGREVEVWTDCPSKPVVKLGVSCLVVGRG